MIITLSGGYLGFPPHTPQQAEEFMVAVASHDTIAEAAPFYAIRAIQKVTNVGPLELKEKP